jgi:hypothetical protein
MVKRLGDVLVIAFTGTAVVVFFIGNSIAWWLIHMAKGDYYPIGYELEMDAAMFFALLVSAVLLIFIVVGMWISPWGKYHRTNNKIAL